MKQESNYKRYPYHHCEKIIDTLNVGLSFVVYNVCSHRMIEVYMSATGNETATGSYEEIGGDESVISQFGASFSRFFKSFTTEVSDEEMISFANQARDPVRRKQPTRQLPPISQACFCCDKKDLSYLIQKFNDCEFAEHYREFDLSSLQQDFRLLATTLHEIHKKSKCKVKVAPFFRTKFFKADLDNQVYKLLWDELVAYDEKHNTNLADTYQQETNILEKIQQDQQAGLF